MDYDDLLTDYVGEFGLYQRIIFVLTSLVAIGTSFTNLGIVFVAAIPEHWCYVEELEDFSKADRMNISIPLEKTEDGDKEHSSCKMYKRDYDNVSLDITGYSVSDNKIGCQDGWEFDQSIYRSSIVTEWNLVCDRLFLRATTISVYMAGYMVGVIISGSLSDRFGRKKILFISVLGMLSFNITLAFSTSFIMFLLLRFLGALFVISSFTCAFVMVVEMVGPKWRLHTGAMIEYFWAIGLMSMAGIAYFIRNWRTLQLVLAMPSAVILIIIWFVPESPRWLYMKHRHEEADKIVRKMAKINKKQLPDDFKIKIKENKNGYIWDLFRIKALRMRTINLCFNWCVNSLVYYGLSLNTSALSGDPYLNFFISGAVEVPAYLFVQLNPLCCGRRAPLGGTMILAGAALLATLLPHDVKWLNLVLAMLGKFAISASFAIVYIFSAELYPTQVRNVAVACGSFSARIGGILAPYIAQMGSISTLIPIIIFGVSSILAGGLAFLLPETKGKHLPETLDEFQQQVADKKSGAETNGKVTFTGLDEKTDANYIFTNEAYQPNGDESNWST